jgi:type IV secretion system protein VirB9
MSGRWSTIRLPEMVLAALAITPAITLAAFPAAAESPARSPVIDGRIRDLQYSPDRIYPLQGRVGFQIDLQFEDGEFFVGMGAGDLAGLSFVAQDNHLFLKPKAARVGTNITVLTNRRQYQFDYATVPAARAARGGGWVEPVYVLRFHYPPVAAAPPAPARIASQLAAGRSARPRNEDYWYCGAPALMPVSAWDDGAQTTLRFGASAEQPAIFVRNEDGSESLLNYSMHGDQIVVQRLARQLVLRRGKLHGCVVNKGYAGSGGRLPSGTVAPDVERAVTGAAP